MPLGPEERVRQDYLRVLKDDYGYPETEIETEYPIPRGSKRTPDRADIVIFSGPGRCPTSDIIGIVETKRRGSRDGRSQLRSYLTATSAIWGVWTNGDTIEYFAKPPGQSSIYDDLIKNIPLHGQQLDDIGITNNKSDLPAFGPTNLKLIFRHVLNTLYANTTISRREKLGNETIKLIFSKIRDETSYLNRPPAFRVGHKESASNVKKRIEKLFKCVVSDLSQDGIFGKHETITLDAKAVAWVVGQLQQGSLVKTPTDVVGDAFEVFAEPKFAGEKGEFFTPRGIIDMAIKLISPMPRETVCDPACGSGRFLIAAMQHIWSTMRTQAEWKHMDTSMFENQKREIATKCFYGIDKETDLVRIAKAYMTISGDGRSNIVHDNSLHGPHDFTDIAKQVYVKNGNFRLFDIILTNPPYGTKTKVLEDDCTSFDLGHKWRRKADGKWARGEARKTDPYVLFIERCLDLLQSKGRMAIVLPETVFHAPTTRYIRHYMSQRGIVVAVIQLPHNTFRPHCNAKTCLLILAKGSPDSDHKVIMATPTEMGHDHNGNDIYRDGTGEIWNDIPQVMDEIEQPESRNNEFVFTVPWQFVEEKDHWIPSYYAYYRKIRRAPRGRKTILLGDLVEDGSILAWDGHGSPKSEEKGRGEIPYIRVNDIVNWELYRNPTSGVNRDTYRRLAGDRKVVRKCDVLFVRRGSYRIGTVAMASPLDEKVGLLLTRELLTLRVVDNRMGINPFYLLFLMSTKFVQDQISHLVFVDTTLPNIANRWRELRLPVHVRESERREMSDQVRSAVTSKWNAQQKIQRVRERVGNLIT